VEERERRKGHVGKKGRGKEKKGKWKV